MGGVARGQRVPKMSRGIAAKARDSPALW